MKKIFLSLFIIVVFGMYSCNDFLYVRPVGQVDEDALLTHEGITMVMTSMYSTFYSTGFNNATTNYCWGDVLGGSANKGSAFADQTAFTALEVYNFVTDNSYLSGKWSYCYNGVFKANVVNAMAEKMESELRAIPGEAKDFYTETLAQAAFMRGYWHFEVIRLYSAAVPYVGIEDYKTSVNPLVSNVDESGNYIYIWDKVVADLQFAYDNLPDVWSSERGRPNKWAAAALLAKVKMYQSSPYNGQNGTSNKWAEVKSLIETIMANGKQNDGQKFRLADTYEDLFNAAVSDWTGESVFDVQYAISGTQTTTNTHAGSPNIAPPGALGNSGWGFLCPSHDFVNMHIVDANGLPFTDYSWRNLPVLSVITGTSVTTDLDVYVDPRLDQSVGRFHTPFLDYAIPVTTDGWVRETTNGGPYLNKKFIGKKSDAGTYRVANSAGSTSKNFHMIRYADVLLWYAETLIELGQHQEAREYVNQVRARAANWYLEAADPDDMSPTTSSYVFDDKINGTTGANAAGNYRIGLWPESQFATKEGALYALRLERHLELGIEGHRWYDLARWGIIGPELRGYLAFERNHLNRYASSTYLDNWVFIPLPITQILMMEGLLVQNAAWK